MTQARINALKILIDIEEKRAYSNLALQHLQDLERREMALVTELVNGVTRMRLRLDYVLGQFLKNPLEKLTVPIRNDLRMGAYQLLFTRIPPHAAINEAVKLAHRYGHAGVAKLVNGVLRNLQREKDNLKYPGPEDPLLHLSVRYSLPTWIVEIWLRDYGFDDAQRLAESVEHPTNLSLRINTLKTTPEDLLERFKAAEIEVLAGSLPEAIRLGRSVALGEIPGYNEGDWYVQGEGAMWASRLLDPKPGETVLDVGAAPGGKTTHLAQLMGDQGRIVAVDCNSARLELVKSNCRRLGIHTVETLTADATEPLSVQADRVLLDAPCSGFGLLARKPDIRWHQTPSEVAELPVLQLRMLDAVSQSVKPGGELLYSTCTIHKAENECVVKEFLAGHPDFALCPIQGMIPEKWEANVGMIQLMPHVHGVEGFFIARLRRIR